MHHTAMANAKRFFDTYVARLGEVVIVDIGAQDVNGSLKQVAPSRAKYIGVDFVQGKGVDVVLSDPYQLPFEDNSVDVIVSSSCFEHSELFWVLFLELMRILKPHGLAYINAPSNGAFHRYPVDCWRFYPDAGQALQTWAQRQGYNALLLESYISFQAIENWNDFVAIFLKDANLAVMHPNRIIHSFKEFCNGRTSESSSFQNLVEAPEDQLRLQVITGFANGKLPVYQI